MSQKRVTRFHGVVKILATSWMGFKVEKPKYVEIDDENIVLAKPFEEGTSRIIQRRQCTSSRTWCRIRGVLKEGIAVDPLFSERIVFLGGEAQLARIRTALGISENPKLSSVAAHLASMERPYDRFVSLLPEEAVGKFLDHETQLRLRLRFVDRMVYVLDGRDAEKVLQHAFKYPNKQMREALEENYGLIVGDLPGYDDIQIRSPTWLLKAYTKADGTCKILKMDSDRDYVAYQQLELDAAKAEKLHLVHLERCIQETYTTVSPSGEVMNLVSSFVVMPRYCCSLADVPRLSEEALFHHARSLLPGLEYLHSKGCTHNDIKPGNIFITASGGWHLGDWGSLTFPEDPDTDFFPGTTRMYIPIDLESRRCSPELDRWMFVTTLLFKLDPAALGVAQPYRCRDVRKLVDSLLQSEFTDWLTALLDRDDYSEEREPERADCEGGAATEGEEGDNHECELA